MMRILLLLFIVFAQVNTVMAAPGGKIVRDLFDSPIGKFVGIALAIIFLPLIIWQLYLRKKATRETKVMLASLSKVSFNLFDEINLKNRVTDVFTRVHKAWSEQDVNECGEYMTHWYRQNQQMVFLDKWKNKGLCNVCTIKEIKDIQPIHIRLTDDEEFEGTRIMYAIDAEMEDYLVKIDDSSVVEGKKGFKDVESVWTFLLTEGTWKVDNIEQASMIGEYRKMKNSVTQSRMEKLSKQQQA